MSLERTLRDIVDNGDEHDPIAQINCPPTFNLRTATTTRETLWRLAGYGASLTLGAHREGYSTCPVCLSVCVCVFSLFWHLAQSGVQTAVSATSARYGHEI